MSINKFIKLTDKYDNTIYVDFNSISFISPKFNYILLKGTEFSNDNIISINYESMEKLIKKINSGDY